MPVVENQHDYWKHISNPFDPMAYVFWGAIGVFTGAVVGAVLYLLCGYFSLLGVTYEGWRAKVMTCLTRRKRQAKQQPGKAASDIELASRPTILSNAPVVPALAYTAPARIDKSSEELRKKMLERSRNLGSSARGGPSVTRSTTAFTPRQPGMRTHRDFFRTRLPSGHKGVDALSGDNDGQRLITPSGQAVAAPVRQQKVEEVEDCIRESHEKKETHAAYYA